MKLTRHTVLNFLNFTSSLLSVDAVLRPTFIRKLCCKMQSVVTFTFMQNFDQNFVFFTERRHVDRQRDAYFCCKFALFLVSGLKDKKLIKKANLHEN